MEKVGGMDGYCHFYIMCLDKDNKPVNIGFEGKKKMSEVLSLFKRFNIVATLESSQMFSFKGAREASIDDIK